MIDINETLIGNYGAKCVAAVISLCDGLEEIRLSNCGIKDDGAIALFEELREADSVIAVDLSHNAITEKSFDALIQLLNTNKKIQRVELKGIQVKSKFALNKLKPHHQRVIT